MGISRLTAQFSFDANENLTRMINEYADKSEDEEGVPDDVDFVFRMSEIWELALGEDNCEWQTLELGREELVCEYKSLQCKVMEIEKFPGENSTFVTEGLEQALSHFIGRLADNCKTFERYGDNFPITLFDRFFYSIYGSEIGLEPNSVFSGSKLEKLMNCLQNFPLEITVDLSDGCLPSITFSREGSEKFVHQVREISRSEFSKSFDVEKILEGT